MYWIIFKLVFSILLILGILIPIVPKMRREAIQILSDSDADLLHDVLEFIDNGFANIGEAMIAVIAYIILTICVIIVGALLSLAWPLLVFLLIVGFIFYKLNKKEK